MDDYWLSPNVQIHVPNTGYAHFHYIFNESPLTVPPLTHHTQAHYKGCVLVCGVCMCVCMCTKVHKWTIVVEEGKTEGGVRRERGWGRGSTSVATYMSMCVIV